MKKNEMQCKDFREIADSYLSDELLVETNHEVFRHLENCESCRRELGGRREVRSKLHVAVISAPESQIDAVFAANLRQSLEKEAFRGNSFSDFFQTIFQTKMFAATAAALLVAFLIGFAFWGNSGDGNYVASNNNFYKTAWTNVSTKALGDHEHCALDKYDYWKEKDVTETAEEKVFGEKVINKIRSETTRPVELISIHDCEVEGKNFHHTIVNVGNHIVSITQTASEIAPNANQRATAPELFAMRRENFELAGFTENGEAFYVISDLPEAENKRIAEIFSGSLEARNAAAFKFASANYALYTANANF